MNRIFRGETPVHETFTEATGPMYLIKGCAILDLAVQRVLKGIEMDGTQLEAS